MAVETHGPMDDATGWYLSDMGRKISKRSGDPLDGNFFISTDQNNNNNNNNNMSGMALGECLHF